MKRILSLGAGVQSTTVALMAAYGEIEPLDAAIFADTGWEPAAVYAHLDKLETELAAHGIPIHRVSAGNIRDDHIDPAGEHLFIRTTRKHPHLMGKQRTSIPVFVTSPRGPARYTGEEVPTRGGKVRRTCTSTYKIEPVQKKIRELLGLAYRQRWPLEPVVEQLFGISYDEIQRMSDSGRPAIVHAYPLVDRRMTRDDCHAWMADHGWSAPRSACIGCPFHRNDEWRRLRDEAPDEWADAVAFDHRLRERHAAGLTTLDGIPFLHDTRVPLDEAAIDDVPAMDQLSLFDETCTGFCGT